MSNQMQGSIHSNMNHALPQGMPQHMGQSQNLGQNQGFNHLNQNLMSGMMQHRQPPPQRTNSFAMHQSPPIPRTVGDFQALQRGNSENMSMNSMALGSMGAEMDFSGLR